MKQYPFYGRAKNNPVWDFLLSNWCHYESPDIWSLDGYPMYSY